jgi:diacylglycerol O-acyltransferase
VYGPPYFSAIVSNIPGPAEQTSFAGRHVDAAYPIVPIASGVPVALGALSFADLLCLGLTVRTGLADPEGLVGRVGQLLEELAQGTRTRAGTKRNATP